MSTNGQPAGVTGAGCWLNLIGLHGDGCNGGNFPIDVVLGGQFDKTASNSCDRACNVPERLRER